MATGVSGSGPSGSQASEARTSGLSPWAEMAIIGTPSICSSAATVSALAPDCDTSTNASAS